MISWSELLAQSWLPELQRVECSTGAMNRLRCNEDCPMGTELCNETLKNDIDWYHYVSAKVAKEQLDKI